MNGGGRPEPVRRFLRRPVWWVLAGVVLAAALFVLGDLRTAWNEDERIAGSLHLVGVVDDDYEGGHEVRVTYTNPLTDQRIREDVHVWDHSLLPGPGERVDLDVDPDDPGGVRLAGDTFPATANLFGYTPFVGLPLAWWAMRRWAVWRTERLAGAPGPSFAMLGAVFPPRRVARHCELHLYPLDSRPGAPALCVVPVLVTGGAPLNGIAIQVEVKGSPRPFGRVVARLEERVVWPSARALGLAGRPRPDRLDQSAAPLELVGIDPGRPPRAKEWAELSLRPLVASGVAAVVAAITVTITLSNAAEAGRVARGGTPVTAEVIGTVGEGDEVEVVYDDPRTGEDRKLRVEVGDEEELVVGRRYPARIDDSNRALVFDAHPYDSTTPLAFGTAPLAISLTFVARRWRSWRRSAEVGRSNAWTAVDVAPVPGTDGLAALRPPGRDAILCTVEVPRARRLAGAHRGALAGRPEPGEFVALASGDRLVWLSRPAHADRRLALLDRELANGDE